MQKFIDLYKDRICQTEHALKIHILYCYAEICERGTLSCLKGADTYLIELEKLFSHLRGRVVFEQITTEQKEFVDICTKSAENLVIKQVFKSSDQCFSFFEEPALKFDLTNKTALVFIFDEIAEVVKEKLFPESPTTDIPTAEMHY